MMRSEEEDRFRSLVSELGQPNDENAFHSLLELDDSWMPYLLEAGEREVDPKRKASLVQIIWRSQNRETVPFLGRMLMDPDDMVWKEALNGLVALKSASAEREVVNSIKTCPEPRRVEWFKEALSQMKDDCENR